MGILESVIGGTPDRSGLSAATKALLLVLAAKAAKDYMAHRQQAPQAPSDSAGGGGLGGVLGGLLGGQTAAQGGLGSLLGGGGLGGVLSGLGGAGVLGSLVEQFGKSGHGDVMRSWIGTGSNQPIAPAQLAQALGPGPLQELESRTGMPQQALLEQLAHELPSAMNHITPQGRLPTDDELTPTA